jgi:hypothetical protein
MAAIAKAIRIEPAFDDPGLMLEMFRRHAPYRTMAGYLPIKSMGETCQPWFRGNWADKGEPQVEGVETILHNRRFVEAASAFLGGEAVRPTLLVVNVNTPMPAGPIHVDVPSFRGVTRDHYPLALMVFVSRRRGPSRSRSIVS